MQNNRLFSLCLSTVGQRRKMYPLVKPLCFYDNESIGTQFAATYPGLFIWIELND